MGPGFSHCSFTFENDPSGTECPASMLELLGRGGGSDVFKLEGSDRIALKIYRPSVDVDWAKIDYQITHPIHRHSGRITGRSYAWPLLGVRSGGKRVGIAIRYFDSQIWISLDNWVEPHLIERLDIQNNSLSRRILILRNLAKRVAFLHAAKMAVIDLRPSNVLVHRRTGEVALIDCDSFRVTAVDGVVFPGTHVSAGYILPEAVGAKLRISELGEDQDRYAFAVVAFQVLNHGVHPFQGILTRDVPGAETNDQKAQKGLYPYMVSPSAMVRNVIVPVLQSMHDTWPTELRDLFDLAFLSRMRPSARAWHRYFNGILSNSLLARCPRFPTDARHIRFRQRDCGMCVRESAIAHIRSVDARTVSAQPSPQYSKKRNSLSAWGITFGVFAAVLIVALIALLVREQQLYEATVHGNAQALRSYVDSCFFCTQKSEMTSRAAVLERTRYAAARGNFHDLSAYIESCFICTFKAAAMSEIEQLREEGERYQSASGDIEKLRAYLQNCRICAFRSAATAELERLQRETIDRAQHQKQMQEQAEREATVSRERRQYEAARGDIDKLQQYIRACQVCEYQSGATAEIASIERLRHPVVSLSVENQTSQSLALIFYSPSDRSRAWPGGNRHYILERASSRNFSLNCVAGDKICYAAWFEQGGAFGSYWGAGYGGEQSCTNCCYTCPSAPTAKIALTDTNSAEAPSPSVLFEVRNRQSSMLEIAFFSQTRNGHTWPGVGQTWRLEGRSTRTYKLNCEPGESICYGASPLDHTPIHWGAGASGGERCTSCCTKCDGARHEISLEYRETE